MKQDKTISEINNEMLALNKYRFIDEPDAKGKPQHLHTLNGAALLGTSTVLGVLAKPLTWWAAGLAVGHLGWTPIKDPKTRKAFPKADRLAALQPRFEAIQTMDIETFLVCLDEAYYAHSKKLDTSAVAGTDMHAILEQYVKTCIDVNGGEPVLMEEAEHEAVLIFAEWAVNYGVGKFLYSEAHCYSENLWTGGIVDLIYEDKAGNLCLLDFKSAKEAYDVHFMQNAGYDIAIAENGILDKEGNVKAIITKPIAYYGVFPFGMEHPVPSFREDTENLKGGFRACVFLHKLIKGLL